MEIHIQSVRCQMGSARTCARPEGKICVRRMTSVFVLPGGGRGVEREVRGDVSVRKIGFRDGWRGSDRVCYKETPGLV